MILFALSFLLILVFMFYQRYFIFALMLFFALFDMFDGFYKDEKVFAAIRYAVPLSLTVVYIFRYNVLRSRDQLLLLLFVYLLILLIYTPGDLVLSAKITTSIILTLLMIPIGRQLGAEIDFAKAFERFNRFLLIAIPVYVISANVFHFGESYSDDFSTGFLITSRMYLAPIVIFLAVHYVITNKENSLLLKLVDMAFILINICLIIIVTRRTSMGMLAVSLAVYTLFNRQLFFRMALMLVILGAALVFSYPLYEQRLNAQLEQRERIQNIDTYEEEGRYLETLFLMDFLENRARTTQVLFGDRPFDTLRFGNWYFGYDRAIHSDINMILYSTGVVGLLLFAAVFFRYFVAGIGGIPPEDKKLYYPLLLMFLIVLLPGRFIGTLTFAPLLMLLLSSAKYHTAEEELPEPEPEPTPSNEQAYYNSYLPKRTTI
ncbi:hypothetical protein [Pontibacter mangrovi]|uniref:O-antigen ligase domain-containing protein n=1 Tax=Pontibacter mangrovi TaxID=2589816 RepID=A0A501W1N9_9BACT|nr:hypothetical protein [Pontibacter mangrovi]TPE42515.1 hypothetical protein FJM65_18105 [Pontibacter mangrovi]